MSTLFVILCFRVTTVYLNVNQASVETEERGVPRITFFTSLKKAPQSQVTIQLTWAPHYKFTQKSIRKYCIPELSLGYLQLLDKILEQKQVEEKL